MQPATCGHCQKTFTPKPRSKGRFCSHACNYAALRTRRPVPVCGHCEKAFTPKASNRRNFCSRECSFADQKAKAKERITRLAKAKMFRHSSCTDCGYLMPYHPNRQRCEPCAKQKASREAREKAASQSAKLYRCKVCNGEFSVPYGWAQRTVCSEQCRLDHQREPKVRNNAIRRARKRGAEVEVFGRKEIYARDEWMCHICGKPIDRTKKAPHPLSPSIDHVIALARGGSHTRANVKAAHFLCNSIKSDSPAVRSHAKRARQGKSRQIFLPGPRS